MLITIDAILVVLLLSAFYCLWKCRRRNAVFAKKELELQASNRIKDRIFAVMGHDLNGYISSIPATLQVYEDSGTSASEREFLRDQLKRNAIASYETLQNLLQWGKAQMQGVLLKQTVFDAHEMIADVLSYVNIMAEGKKVHISNHLAPQTSVYADINHFKFVMRNLLSNAVKYTWPNGNVYLDAVSGEQYIVFSVKDTGTGLTHDKKAEIFDSLGMSSPGTASEKGHGIGLKLCKEFVEANGGTIWVESEPGKGATFYFTLKSRDH